jgi:S1-C subfamily serine protease
MGSSGGPLLNLKGEVIGMTTTSDDDTPCCTYAIPSNTIKHIVPILVETGKYIHPWLGLTTATLTSDIAERVEGLEPNFKGVLVHSIVNNGPADKAGLKDIIINENNETGTIGDIITAIDGEPVTTADEFNAYIDEHKFVGNNITLSIYRSGQILNLPVTLGQNPDFSSNDK